MVTDRTLTAGPLPTDTDEASITGSAATGSPRRSTQSRLPSLTGLRFFAALAVFFFHASLPFPNLRLIRDDGLAAAMARASAQAGGLGVTFFFVLSGFVLTWSARDTDTARAFLRRRYVKICPNYVVAWVLAMVLFAGTSTPAWRAIVNLLMVQSWVPDFNTNFSVDPPSWSLGAEAVFYALFPVLFFLIRRIQRHHLKFWIWGVVAGIVATPLIAYLAIPGGAPFMPNAPSTSSVQYWFGYVLPLPRVLDFALGILVARAVAAGRWRNIGMVWSGVLLVVSYVIASVVPEIYGQRAICIIPIALLIAAAAIADSDGRFTLFRNRVTIWLGNISFAFYLLHYIVLAYYGSRTWDHGW